MHRDMVGLIAGDLILRLVFAGTLHVPFVIHVLDVDPDDLAADVPCFRIPGHVIANFESVFQKDPAVARLVGQSSNRVWNETWTVIERCWAGFTTSNQNCNHGPKDNTLG